MKKRNKDCNESWLLLTWQTEGSNMLTEVQFDVVTTESYEAVMAISAHPVERGAPIVDHARPEPVRLSIEGFVSNTPLPSNIRQLEQRDYGIEPRTLTYSEGDPDAKIGPPIQSPGGLTQAVVNAVGGLISPSKPLPKSVDAFGAKGTAVDRALVVFLYLESARTARSLVTLSTKYHDITSLLIERVAVDRTVESAGGLPFQIELTQIRIVDSETVNYPKPSENHPRAKPEQKKGSQQPSSVLYNAGEAANIFPLG